MGHEILRAVSTVALNGQSPLNNVFHKYVISFFDLSFVSASGVLRKGGGE